MDNPVQLTTELTRSSFLRGDLGVHVPVNRPPWAVSESKFQELCTGCDACINSCPTFILGKARGGYPVVDFDNNECTFCGKCVDVCKPRALQIEEGRKPWNLIAFTDTSCLSSAGITCRICGDRCNARAINFKLAIGGKATPVIEASRCTGCGACVAPCPVDAVKIQMENKDLT